MVILLLTFRDFFKISYSIWNYRNWPLPTPLTHPPPQPSKSPSFSTSPQSSSNPSEQTRLTTNSSPTWTPTLWTMWQDYLLFAVILALEHTPTTICKEWKARNIKSVYYIQFKNLKNALPNTFSMTIQRKKVTRWTQSRENRQKVPLEICQSQPGCQQRRLLQLGEKKTTSRNIQIELLLTDV